MRHSLWVVATTTVALSSFALSSSAHAVQLSTVMPVDAPTSGAPFHDQRGSAIAAGGGGYVAVWLDGDINLSVRLSRVSSTGIPTDNPPLIVAPPGTNNSPGIAYDGARFVVTWEGLSTTSGNGLDVFGAYFDEVLGTLGAPFVVAGGIGGQYSPVPVSGSSSVLVLWESTTGGPQGTLVSQAGAVSAPFAIGSATASGLTGSFGGGTFLAAWHDDVALAIPAIFSSTVSTTGTVGTATQVSDGAKGKNAAVDFDGTNFFVVWDTVTNTLRGRSIKPNGTAAAAAFELVNSSAGDALNHPQVSIAGGRAVLLYQDNDTNINLPQLGAARVGLAGPTFPDGADGILISSGTFLNFGPLPVYSANSRRHAMATDGSKVIGVWGGFEYVGLVGQNAYTILIDPAEAGAMAQRPPVLLSRTANYQLNSVVASNGNMFLVVWEDDRKLDISGVDLYGLRVGLDGTPIDSAPILLTSAVGDQILPSVAAIPGGAFLVAWADEQDLQTVGDPINLYAAKVPAVGTPGSPFAISKGLNAHLAPTVTASPTGWLVAWEDWRGTISDPPLTGVWAHLVSAAGVPTGADFAIAASAGTTATTACAARATWNGTRYFVAYEQPCWQMRTVYSQATPDTNILGAWVSSTGTVGNKVTIAQLSGAESAPSVAGDSKGNVTVVWRDQTQPTETIQAATLTDNAVTVSAPVVIANGNGAREAPSVAATSDGHLLVSWIDNNPASVRARLAAAGLGTLGDPFVITSAAPYIVTDPLKKVINPVGGALSGTPRVTPSATIAVATSGEALLAWTEVDAFGDQNLPRTFYRKVGALPNGATCSVAGGCSDGFCTNNACCNAPCDGICQACGANGCIEKPASDVRCSSGSVSCEPLSTACRTYSNAPLTSCVAFGQCGDPGSLADCTVYTDKPDGTPCATAGCDTGTCGSGACVCPYSLPVFPARAISGGCAVGGSGGDGIWIVVAILIVMLRRRSIAVLGVLGLCAACAGPPALELDLKLSDAVLSATHSARIILSSTDETVFTASTATDATNLAPDILVHNLDADGDGRVDVVVELGPNYTFGRDNRFRLEPVTFAKAYNVSVRAEVYDGLGNRFARLGGQSRVITDERVNAILSPGQVTKLGLLEPTCVATCPTSTWSISAADANQTLTGVGQVTALAKFTLAGSTLSALVVGSQHQDAKVTGGTQWSNNGAVRIWTGAAQLNATADVTIVGSFGGEQLGAAIAVTDTDKDGQPDLFLGAPGADGGKGAVFIVYGGTWPAEIDLAAPPTGVRVKKLPGIGVDERLGSALIVVSAKDVTGALVDHVIAGAPGSDRVYVIPPGLTDLSTAAKSQGRPGSALGRTLASYVNLLAVGAPLDVGTAAEPGHGLVVVTEDVSTLPPDATTMLHVRGQGGDFGASIAYAALGENVVYPSLVVAAPGEGGGLVMVFPPTLLVAGSPAPSALDATRTLRTDAGALLGADLTTVRRGLGDLLVVGAPGRSGTFVFGGRANPAEAGQPELTDVAIDGSGRPAATAVTAGTAAPGFGTRSIVGAFTHAVTPDLVVGSNDSISLFKGPIL